ncbi:MAG: aldolase/citrate lyase family protein [Anaerolineaceae bacterium]|nr:aldolase/citrate lyase family protein [Anaerolineaceae bacterium]
MRKSKVLAQWRDNQFARFCGMGQVLPFFIRYAAHYKYDGIWLDLEHRNFDAREVQHLQALCHLYDIDCMIRPPTVQRTRLYRYLEDGAAGLMIPFVSDAQMARQIVAATKFPPLGNRGLDGAGLDYNFGGDSWAPNSSYIADANRETFIVAQIETPEAVAKAEEIAAVPGIDALFVGPGDLGLRLDAYPEIGQTLDEAVAQVAAACDQHGKVWGRTASSIDEVDRYRRSRSLMIPYGGDFALMNVLREASADLDQILAE